jgi:hypothetical protein
LLDWLALWCASVGDVCALLDEVGGGGLLISSILRIGAVRGGVARPLLVPDTEAGLRMGSSSISSMLRTGDRGVTKGETALPDPVELADPLVRPEGIPSNKAKTSLRSSSNIDSSDITIVVLLAVAAAGSLCLENLSAGVFVQPCGLGYVDAKRPL